MPNLLTRETIEATVNALPIQGRIMLRLLLLQHLDVIQEDIEFMAADRPDPRFQAGVKSTVTVIAKEAIQGVADRAAQYRTQIRQKRERMGLQIECLRQQIRYGELLCTEAERLLTTTFGIDANTLKTLTAQARTAIPKPAMRELDQQWDKNDITEEEYRKKRLSMAYQTELRKLDRERKRLETAQREYTLANSAPLQDHEIAHIWGIPAGTLAARKVKFLHQYVQGLHAAVQQPLAGQPPVDLWKETFVTLMRGPIERSTVAYDWLEQTESALLEKLQSLAMKTMPEDLEGRFWPAVAQSLFALQRLATIQADRDLAPDTMKQEWLNRTAPLPKDAPLIAPQDAKTEEPQLGEMGEHVLRSMMGEEPRR